MTRCADCGRRKATDRQWDRWCKWTGNKRRERRRRFEPLWFKFGTRCMGWYDCPGAYGQEHQDKLTLNWYERRCLVRAGRIGDHAD